MKYTILILCILLTGCMKFSGESVEKHYDLTINDTSFYRVIQETSTIYLYTLVEDEWISEIVWNKGIGDTSIIFNSEFFEFMHTTFGIDNGLVISLFGELLWDSSKVSRLQPKIYLYPNQGAVEISPNLYEIEEDLISIIFNMDLENVMKEEIYWVASNNLVTLNIGYENLEIIRTINSKFMRDVEITLYLKDWVIHKFFLKLPPITLPVKEFSSRVYEIDSHIIEVISFSVTDNIVSITINFISPENEFIWDLYPSDWHIQYFENFAILTKYIEEYEIPVWILGDVIIFQEGSEDL